MAKIKKPIQNYYKDHISPPFAKIFYPTADEFADPFGYVESIRDEGREYGVIKIIPPADFKPPFSLARSLEFKPRSQRLSMTDAFNREHYLILDKLKLFYRSDEAKRKPPKFGKELLNLAIFFLAVDSYEVRKDPDNIELWKIVALLCNIDSKFAPALKLYYYSVISPFRVSLRTEQQLRRRARTGRHAIRKYKLTKRGKGPRQWWYNIRKSPTPETEEDDEELPTNPDLDDNVKIELPDLIDEPGPSSITKLPQIKPSSPTDANFPFRPLNFCLNLENINRKRSTSRDEEDEPGPIVKRIRSIIPTPPQIVTDDSAPSDGYQTPSPPAKEESPSENIPLPEPKIRRSSRKATAAAVKKIASFHNGKKVLSPENQQSRTVRPKKPKRPAEDPPLQKQRELLPVNGKVPKKCNRKRHRNSQTPKHQQQHKSSSSRSIHLKPGLVKMFFEAPDRFSLQKFREHADAFKAEFFHAKKASDVTVDEVEKIFWKNVGDLHSDLFAFYGADLNSGNFGSGFPLRAKTDEEYEEMSAEVKYYSEHPWNLNNLPIASQSAFYHLEENISGMTIPWVYVGMCFSLFCWHVEDHWTYSINYMHEGETKVWYGIPEKHASKFDYLMRQTAPELFEEHPDLLHHMSTMAHPQFLVDNDIDVYTVHQNIGEIVITFPRAYHAGFNAGYNVAEAVNFAPYDWLQFGRLCLQNYADVGRACVFSHDSLVLSMAKDFDELDPTMLNPVIEEYTAMIKRDLGYRRYLKECDFNFGNHAINLLDVAPSDDIRSCIHCNTLLYSAAIICPHLRVTCPLHFKSICKICTIDKLRFAYSSDPISLYSDLKEFLTVSDPWLTYIGLIQKVVKDLMNHRERYSYEDLIRIKEAGEKAKFPLTKDFEDLDLLLTNFEEFAAEVQSYLPTFEEATIKIDDIEENRTYFPPLRDNSNLTLEDVKRKVDEYPVHSKHLDKIMEHYILKADGGKDRCQQIIEEIRNSSEDYKILLVKSKALAKEFSDWPQDDSSVLQLSKEVNRIEWLLRVDVIKRVRHLDSYQQANEIRDEAIKAGCKLKAKEFTTWTLQDLQDLIKEGEKYGKNCLKEQNVKML
uniref:Uncharacterized protein n=1 Tax=Panagrolaimus superbus TaxID=310955 RepID=A0A914Y5A0_9BILA